MQMQIQLGSLIWHKILQQVKRNSTVCHQQQQLDQNPEQGTNQVTRRCHQRHRQQHTQVWNWMPQN